jgi:hypothetical protein
MANLGDILGSAIAGGIAGGGKAAETSLASSQKALQDQDLVKMQSDLDEQKQMRILELNQAYDKTKTAGEHDYQTGRDTASFAHADATLDKTQGFTSKENALTRDSEDRRSAANNSTSIAVAQIHAAAQHAATEAAKSGGTSQVLDDGSLAFINHNGVATPIMVPDKDGNMVKAYSSKIPEGAKLVLAQLAKQSEDTTNGTEESRAAAASGIRELVNNGYDLGKFGGRQITPGNQQKFLADYAKGGQAAKDAVKVYDAATGIPGSAQAYLTQSGTAAPAGEKTTTPGSTPGMPGTPDTGAGTKKPPLKAGAIPTIPVEDQYAAPAFGGTPPVSAPIAATAPSPVAGAAPPTAAPAPMPATGPVNTAAPMTNVNNGIIAQQQAAQQNGIGGLVAGGQGVAPPTQQAFRMGTDPLTGLPLKPNALNPIGLTQ